MGAGFLAFDTKMGAPANCISSLAALTLAFKVAKFRPSVPNPNSKCEDSMVLGFRARDLALSKSTRLQGVVQVSPACISNPALQVGAFQHHCFESKARHVCIGRRCMGFRVKGLVACMIDAQLGIGVPGFVSGQDREKGFGHLVHCSTGFCHAGPSAFWVLAAQALGTSHMSSPILLLDTWRKLQLILSPKASLPSCKEKDSS